MKTPLGILVILLLLCQADHANAQFQSSLKFPSNKKPFLNSSSFSSDHFFSALTPASCVLQKNTMPFFCRLEHQFFTRTNVKLSFRLGSLDYSNQLEYGADRFRSFR